MSQAPDEECESHENHDFEEMVDLFTSQALDIFQGERWEKADKQRRASVFIRFMFSAMAMTADKIGRSNFGKIAADIAGDIADDSINKESLEGNEEAKEIFAKSDAIKRGGLMCIGQSFASLMNPNDFCTHDLEELKSDLMPILLFHENLVHNLPGILGPELAEEMQNEVLAQSAKMAVAMTDAVAKINGGEEPPDGVSLFGSEPSIHEDDEDKEDKPWL